MPETEKAQPSKEAMVIARGLCSATDHNEGRYPEGYDERPCTCGAIAAAVLDFAREQLREVKVTGGAAIQAAQRAMSDRGALRERNRALVEALQASLLDACCDGQASGTATDSPGVTRLSDNAGHSKWHSAACPSFAALAADAKAGEDVDAS
jgi:hypothetical protein